MVMVLLLVFVLVFVCVPVCVPVTFVVAVAVVVRVLVGLSVRVTVSVFVFVTVRVQLALGSPNFIPWLPMPEKSQRPTCPLRRQLRLPSSQSAPTSLYRAAFSPGRSCIDCAVYKTTSTFGLRLSAMPFTACRGYASAPAVFGCAHVATSSAIARHSRRKSRERAPRTDSLPACRRIHRQERRPCLAAIRASRRFLVDIRTVRGVTAWGRAFCAGWWEEQRFRTAASRDLFAPTGVQSR